MGEVRRRKFRDPKTGKLRECQHWTIRYYRNGRRYEECSPSPKKGAAIDLLRLREGDLTRGVPVTPKLGRLLFEEAAKDLLIDYQVNGHRSVKVAARRIRIHLTPYFQFARMANITKSDVQAYVAHRQAQGVRNRRGDRIGDVSNAEVNRELALLKRMFSLAIQAGKLLHRPHIPMLRERNARAGFFEPEQFAGVCAHLPDALRPIVEFAYITGWRINSEVLTLQWRQVDFEGGEVRLDAGTTKNGEARTFPFTDDLRRLLEARRDVRDRLKKEGVVSPLVFCRLVAESRGGQKLPKPIRAFNKAWKNACVAAGCPGRIPHDLRRTAVRNMVRRGVPERVAMQLTGHKTRSVFERYNIVSPGDLLDAARRLDGATSTTQAASA